MKSVLFSALFSGAVAAGSIATSEGIGDWESLMSGDSSEGFLIEGVANVDAQAAMGLRDKGAVFLDSRIDKDWREGHIQGAIQCGVVTKETLAQHFEPDDTIVFYCADADCSLAAIHSAKASALGYENVHLLEGGFSAWKDAGLPVESGT